MKAIKKKGRLYCPICGIDVTIITMHEPCTITWKEKMKREDFEFFKPMKVGDLLNS